MSDGGSGGGGGGGGGGDVWMMLAGGALVCTCAVVYAVLRILARAPDKERRSGEYFFLDGSRVPSMDEPASFDLSVIVPAYNETERLPKMLSETVDFLDTANCHYEIIVVDDGSKDNTAEVAQDFAKQRGAKFIRVLKLTQNRGKGGAVRMGMLSARGESLLMADADAATDIRDLPRLTNKLQDIAVTNKTGRHAVVVGSRAHLVDEAVATRSVFRTVLMYGFHFLVTFLCVKGIKDTQCGFKLFTRDTGKALFARMHIERWAFDVELLHIAQRLDIPMAEVAVNWKEIEGSKVDPLMDSIQMARDLIRIRALYMFGFWSV